MNPTTSVQDHYDRVLAEHYTPHVRRLRRQGRRATGAASNASGIAGHAGRPGRGSRLRLRASSPSRWRDSASSVLAVDQSQRLLAELRSRTRGLPVEALAADLRDVATLAPTGVELSRSAWVTRSRTSSAMADVDAPVRGRRGATPLPADGWCSRSATLSGELRDLDRAIPSTP